MNDRRSDLQNAFIFYRQPQAAPQKIGDLREKVAQNKTILPSVQPDVVKLPRGGTELTIATHLGFSEDSHE